jgi:hypothetical protein
MNNWDKPLLNFRYMLFERVDLERNEARFYYLSWQPTLIHSNAVVRLCGRKSTKKPPFWFLVERTTSRA